MVCPYKYVILICYLVPVTTNAINEGNKLGQNPKINVKGFLVGNGVTHDVTDSNSVPPFLYQRSFISQSLYSRARASCKDDYYNNQNIPECAKNLNTIYNTLWASGINPYDIYGKCETIPFMRLRRNQEESTHPLFSMWDFTRYITNGAPCINDTSMTLYFNVSLFSYQVILIQSLVCGC